MVKLFSKNSNLCDHNSPTSQTDGQADRQTTCNCNTALCTKVHRAVKRLYFNEFLNKYRQMSYQKLVMNIACAPSSTPDLDSYHRRHQICFAGLRRDNRKCQTFSPVEISNPVIPCQCQCRVLAISVKLLHAAGSSSLFRKLGRCVGV